MKEVKINENERKCLEFLAEIYPDDEANCTYFRVIASKTGLDEKKVRRAVRSLAKKKLAEYVRGLFDQEGMVAGSGYMATFEGAMLVNPCKICGRNLCSFDDGRCSLCWEDRKCQNCGREYHEHSYNEWQNEFKFAEKEPVQSKLIQ